MVAYVTSVFTAAQGYLASPSSIQEAQVYADSDIGGSLSFDGK